MAYRDITPYDSAWTDSSGNRRVAHAYDVREGGRYIGNATAYREADGTWSAHTGLTLLGAGLSFSAARKLTRDAAKAMAGRAF